MMLPVTRRAPRSAADQHAPESHAEAAGSVLVLERHQVVLGELAKAVEEKPDVRQKEDERQQREQPAETLGHHTSVDQMVRDGHHRRRNPAWRHTGWAESHQDE